MVPSGNTRKKRVKMQVLFYVTVVLNSIFKVLKARADLCSREVNSQYIIYDWSFKLLYFFYVF